MVCCTVVLISTPGRLFSVILNFNAFLPITSPWFLNLELSVKQLGIWASPYLINNRLKI
jgi:hypothetical protein